MTERRPIVLINGKLQELPDGDTVPGSGGGGGGGSSLPSLIGNAGKKLRVSQDESAAEWAFDYGMTPLGPTPHGAHRYWRVVMTDTDAGNYAQIGSLSFRSVPNGPQLAAGGTAIESGHYGSNVAANAFDGNPSTVWESQSGSENSFNLWVGYDFGAPVSVAEIEMIMHPTYETDERPRAGWVQYSDDGSNWASAWPFGTWTWSDLIRASTSPFYSPSVPSQNLKPWYWSPPSASTFATFFGDAAPTVTEDADVGLCLDMGATPSGTRNRIRVMAVPAGDWSMKAKLVPTLRYATSCGFGLCAFNSANNRLLSWLTLWNGTMVLVRHTLNSISTDTFSYSEARPNEIFYEIAFDDATDTFTFRYSRDGKMWREAGTELLSAWLGAITHIGFVCYSNSASSFSPVLASVPYFSVT